jgi:hypothetical protein
LTGSLGAKRSAVLGPLAKPRPGTVVLHGGRELTEDDPRHHGQRMHEAMEDVCDRLLRTGTLPDAGGTPAAVILTIPEHDLAARTRWGVTSGATTLSGRHGPGSDRRSRCLPPGRQRHHSKAWVDGGGTDLDNLTLLCSYHHHNFASRGWTCVMVDSLPAWVPPRWVDREQPPLRNTRVTARREGEVLRR